MSLPPGMDPSMIPIGKPPSGKLPNFVDPESTAGVATAVTILFTVLMALFVIVRMYTKLFISRSIDWDDCECNSKLRLRWQSALTTQIDTCVFASVSSTLSRRSTLSC